MTRKALLAGFIMIAAVPAWAAPQVQIPITGAPSLIVLMNTDTAYSLPTTPAWDMGHVIKVFDNLGTSGTSNITVSGKCASGTTTINTNYGSATFTWTGACWQ